MKKLKSFRTYIIVFLFVFSLTYLLLYTGLECISRFITIPQTYIVCCASVFSVLASIVVLICLNKTAHKVKSSKLSFWLDMNYPKLLTVYIFLVIIFTSIRNVPIWTKEEIENILSIQWTIFGLSLTIFLVWNVIIVEFLRKTQPKDYNASDSIQQYQYLQQRILFSQNIEVTFSSVILLVANLFLLILSTVLVYITCVPTHIETQNMVICSFYFTTNSIVALFIDILRPLNKDKKDLLNENVVTKEELDQAETAIIFQTFIDGIKNDIMNSDKYTDEEKKELYVSFLNALRDGFSKKDEPRVEDRFEDTPSPEDMIHGKTSEL